MPWCVLEIVKSVRPSAPVWLDTPVVRDTDVFGALLGLSADWVVRSVQLSHETAEVFLLVEHVGKPVCPECEKAAPVHDHSAERRWRHLDTMQYVTWVYCRAPRVNCPEHGVKQLAIPWAGPKSRFTEIFEAVAIRMLQMTKCQARTARLLRLSPGQIHDIMHRAVKRGLDRRELSIIEHLSIDEKSFQRGHDFGTVLCDVREHRVIEVVRGRNEVAAKRAFAALPSPEKVKTITMDMAEAYRNAATLNLSQADVIHDRFHIAAMLGAAVDATRRAEVKRSPELEGSRYVWLENPENLTRRQRPVFEALMTTELKTAEAYALKQTFQGFFEQEDVFEATQFFVQWRDEVKARDVPRLHKVAATLEQNLLGLLNYVKWKLTNGYAEAVNALIQEIKTVARGFRRFDNFRVAILFFLGKLELNPRKCS